jgi:hypothetical protein
MNAFKREFRKYGRSQLSKWGAEAASTALSTYLPKLYGSMQDLPGKTGEWIGTTFDTALDGKTGGSSVGTSPYSLFERSIKRSGSNLIQSTREHRTNFTWGRPQSRTVKQLARQNGTYKRVMEDTLTSTTFSEAAISRRELEQQYGFNEKLWFTLGPVLTSTVGKALALFQAEPDKTSSERDSDANFYGMVIREISEFTFSNSNAYFPINMKFHVIGNVDLDLASSAFLLNGTNDILTDQDPGAIPKNQQLSTLVSSPSPGIWTSLSVAPKTRLDTTGSFSQNHVKIKSFSKKLAPGDTWKLRMTHNTGPG